MSAKWSDKGTKTSAVAADTFMMIDSEDATPSTTNKLITKADIQKTLVTDVDAQGNNIDNFGYIQSNAADAGTDEAINLGNSQRIAFRNNANDDNASIRLNANDVLIFDLGGGGAFSFRAADLNLGDKDIRNAIDVMLDSDTAHEVQFRRTTGGQSTPYQVGRVDWMYPIDGGTGTYGRFENLVTDDSAGAEEGAFVFSTLQNGASNIETLRLSRDGVITSGRLQGAQGSDVASAAGITVGEGNTFKITGTTTINTMALARWQFGSMVTLYFDSSITITSAVTTNAFELAGGVSFNATSGASLTVVAIDATNNHWREVCRTVGV